jgi:IMP dehydrogenase
MARQVNRFFSLMDQQGLAVTYGEVRLRTMYSDILPAEVSVETRFSRRVPLKIPVVSAAMDTVTGSRMAIAMAKLGGIGVIHKNLDPTQQRNAVRRVKFHLSGRISTPITVNRNMTLEEVENMRREKEFDFYSFPVIDGHGKLVGVITKDDFDF